MIIKEKDSVEPSLAKLEKILSLPKLTAAKQTQIKKEQKILKAGRRGEQDSAYFIDFYYKDSKNWAIIHDLRIEHGGCVAQIDHLLINRFLEMYVLETKHYSQGIKITERGEFLAYFNKHYQAIESPIEQNKRHIKVLKELLKGEALLPNRLGFTMRPSFQPYILVSPKSRVIRPKSKTFNTDMVIKSDEFHQQIQKNINNASVLSDIRSAANMISQDSLKTIAKKIAAYHNPIEVDYYSKFSISEVEADEPKVEAAKSKMKAAEPKQTAPISNQPPNNKPAKNKPVKNQSVKNKTSDKTSKLKTQSSSSKYYCYRCKRSISKKVATFCFSNQARFQRKAYCYNCQKAVDPKTLSSPQRL